MTRADAMGVLLAFIARLITGAQGHWQGCPPKAEQRIYFANHQSHLDGVLIWAALPRALRATTRPIAARDYWTTGRFKHWITREVFNAVYVSRARTADQDPLEPLIDALNNGHSLVIFPEGTRSNKGAPQAFKRELRATWIGAVVFWAAWISGPSGATLLFGVISLLALREYITLLKTRRGGHRSLLLAFFAVLPLQYLLLAKRNFDLFSVFIPVYVFLAIPVVSALAGDPERFLARNAKIQCGIMVCVYGLSHAPALVLLDFAQNKGRGAFLRFFLVMVVSVAKIAQMLASRGLRRRPVARHIDRSFSYRAWALATVAAALLGAALFWITPFKIGQALAMAALAAAAGTLGEFVMSALKRDAGVRVWGNASSVTGAVGLLDRVAPLCFAAPVFCHSVRWYFQLKP